MRDCSYDGKGESAEFRFFSAGSNYTANFDLTGGYIGKGSLQAFSVVNLKSVLMESHKNTAKEGTVITKDLMIMPHPSSSNSKTAVLPKD